MRTPSRDAPKPPWRWSIAVAALATGLAAAVAGPAGAQADRWSPLRAGGQLPEGLVGSAGTVDPGRHRMLVFAGAAWEEDHEEVRNSVWALDLTAGDERWSLLRPAGSAPYYRRRPAAAYDAASDRMLVFGGFYEDQRGYYSDTWFLDFAARETGEWVQHDRGAAHPDGRQAASMIVQAVGAEPEPVHRAILFGGYSVTNRGQDIPYGDVWAFDLRPGHEGWTPITPAGEAPKPRDGHAAVYDAVRDRMIVFGGWNRERRVLTTLDDVWALDLTPGAERWTRLAPEGRPMAVAWHSAAYDPCPGQERMLVFGGYNYSSDRSSSDTWALSLHTPGAETWLRLDTTGSKPTPRDSHAAAYDPLGRRLVVFSGWDGPGEWKRDAWTLDLLPCAVPTPTATWGIAVPTTQVPPPTTTAESTPTVATATSTVDAPTATVTPDDCRDPYEPDDIWYRAKSLAVGEVQPHTFHAPTDKDFVKFEAYAGRHYVLRTLELAPQVDTVLTLYATDGATVLAANDDDPTAAPASKIDWTCQADGTYFASVGDAAAASGCDMRYALRLDEGTAPTAAPSETVTPQRGIAYLPIARTARRGPTATPAPPGVLCDPGFEQGTLAPCWRHGGELAQRAVSALDDGLPPHAGRYALQLGNPELGAALPGETPVPIGSAWVEQQVEVPDSPRAMLRFVYRVVTYDAAEDSLGTVWDVLGVTVDGEEIWSDGNRTVPDLGVRQEIGWRTASVPLSRWRGATVTLRFASFNGRDNAPGAEWYNTWSYVDDVDVAAE